MTLAAVQSAFHNGIEWVSLEAASRLTGESLRTWQWRAQREAAEAQRRGRQALAVKAAPADGKGKYTWWVRRTFDNRLSRCPDRQSREDRAREALLARHPQHIVDRALKRCHWLQQWRKLCEQGDNGATDSDLAGRVVAQARAIERPDFRISVRSLYVWSRRYKQIGPDGQVRGVENVIDRYGSGPSEIPTRSPEAVEFFYELYHVQKPVTIRTCHEVILREARRRRWAWPASYTATVSWLKQHDDLSLTYLMRRGGRAWAHKYLPHLPQDYEKLQPGEMFVCDHHTLDLWCSYKGRQIRPWLTAVEDARTRCCVGWHIGPTPHVDAILCSLRMAFRDWAVPRVMKIDNGRDYTAKAITGYTKGERDRLRRRFGPTWLERAKHLVEIDSTDSRWLGITGELGIEVIFALPYSPWSKLVERWFRRVEDEFGSPHATYCGNSPANRPECLTEILREHPEAVPTLEDVQRGFGEYLDTYHRSDHRGIGGQCPLTVWKSAVHLRRAVGDELAFLMDVRGLYKVGANGVSLKVGVGTFSYGAKSQALKRWVGRKVLVALDPQDVSQAWAFTPDRDKRQIIGRLACNVSVHPCTPADDAREMIAEKMRERSIMHKASRAAARRTLSASARLQEHAQARRTELLATGTDDATAEPRLLPVRTGFEGLSRPARTGFEETYLPPDSADLTDLFEGDETFDPVGQDDDDGMDDLFVNEPADEESDEGLDDLL